MIHSRRSKKKKNSQKISRIEPKFWFRTNNKLFELELEMLVLEKNVIWLSYLKKKEVNLDVI